MRGLIRMLMMFGPMIYRQIKKFQNKKQRQEATHLHERQIEDGQLDRRPPHDDPGQPLN